MLCCLGTNPAHIYAQEYLKNHGITITSQATPECRGILLDVPAAKPQHWAELSQILPSGCHVFGGKLDFDVDTKFIKQDLLTDPEFTARNADITARCALRLACEKLESTLLGAPVLIVGWGRIGKCLAQYLRALGADCRIYARKAENRALLNALGYQGISWQETVDALPRIKILFNTAPEPVISRRMSQLCSDALLIDLASTPGIDAQNAIRARGLPGKMAPESAGELIAQTVIRLWTEDTV